MSLYVLDTDTLSLYQRGHPAVQQRVDSIGSNQLAITVITVEEQLSGWYSLLRSVKTSERLSKAYDRLAEAVKLLGSLQILSFSEAAVQRYEQLKAQKLNIRKMDLRIAAITLENGGILVTRNVQDFGRVPRLTHEDWTA
jgi:tRNA(fMet)-specific endonuclease VapC